MRKKHLGSSLVSLGAIALAVWLILVTMPVAVRASTSAPIRSVDIAGVGTAGDQVIAVGWGKNVSIFLRSDNSGSKWSANVGFDVDYVVLSQNGSWLLVVGNARPFTSTSHSFVRLYGPLACAPGCGWPLIFSMELPHSAWASNSRPVDFKRDASFLAVGTGIVNYLQLNQIGLVYLIKNPWVPAIPPLWSRNVADWVQTVRFAGDGGTVTVGGYWNHTMWNYATPTAGDLLFRWSINEFNDPYYGVGPDLHTASVATGHGIRDNTSIVNGATGVQNWRRTEHGIQREIAMSDAGDCYASSNGINDGNDYQGWFVYLASGTLLWRFQVPQSEVHAVTVDGSVGANDRVVFGGYGVYVYKFGDTGQSACNPPVVGTWYVVHGFVAEVAMTYDGTYSVAGTNDGSLYVFATAAPGLTLLWQWILS